MRYSPLIAAAALIGAPAQAATVIKLTVDGTYSGSVDYATGVGPTFAPRPFTVVATLPLPTSTDTGGQTPPEVFTSYDADQLAFSTPFTSQVGPDPYGNGLADLPGYASAQAIVDTFGHGFYSSKFTLQQYIIHDNPVGGWTYSAGLSLCCATPTSLVNSDLNMTPSRLVDFLELQVGRPVEFGSGWGTYRYVKVGDSERQEYVAGSAIAGVKAVLTSFEVISSVPEPASWAMMTIGFAIVGASLRRRSPASTRA